ncbi:hypothetical protein LAZ67_4003148 [Cordylochernes scorpioides]|uniref:Uncharacterized protein n=1 Tax=Cordylochernes scorpioides TaxID=51811 RepID=A0ABY6KEJ9_9ARAC|nr:hypothetical protein LAZ67_4003148 [Cordylochernes scorpioides]
MIRHRVDRMNKDEKEVREQEIGEFPNNDHGPTTLPPHLDTIILQMATILEEMQPLHPRDLDLTSFDVFSIPSPTITSSAQRQQSPEVFNSSRNHPFQGPYIILKNISPNVVKINRPNEPLNKEHDTIHVKKLRPYTESVPHIAPPTRQAHYVQPKNNYLFPFRHLSPDLFQEYQLPIKPSSSQPLLPLIPNLFTLIQVEPTSSNNAFPVPQLQINHEPTRSQGLPRSQSSQFSGCKIADSSSRQIVSKWPAGRNWVSAFPLSDASDSPVIRLCVFYHSPPSRLRNHHLSPRLNTTNQTTEIPQLKKKLSASEKTRQTAAVPGPTALEILPQASAGHSELLPVETHLAGPLPLDQRSHLIKILRPAPTWDQQLVRIIPPTSLTEWYERVKRIREYTQPTTRQASSGPPYISGPYTSTQRFQSRSFHGETSLPSLPCRYCGQNHCNKQCRKQSLAADNTLLHQVQTPEQRSSLRDAQIHPIEQAITKPISTPQIFTSHLPKSQLNKLPIEQTSQVTIEQTSQVPIAQTTQVPIEQTSQVPIEQTSQVPIEQTSHVSIAQTSQDPTTTDPHELTLDDEMSKNPQHDHRLLLEDTDLSDSSTPDKRDSPSLSEEKCYESFGDTSQPIPTVVDLRHHERTKPPTSRGLVYTPCTATTFPIGTFQHEPRFNLRPRTSPSLQHNPASKSNRSPSTCPGAGIEPTTFCLPYLRTEKYVQGSLVDMAPARKMEQGREEDSKEPMEADTDYESGENPTFLKIKENTLGRTQEIALSQEDATPPPAVSDVLGSLTRTLHQLSAATGLSRDVELPRYDGSYEAQSFFDNYDAQVDLAQLQYTERLRRLPNLLQESLTDGLPVADQRIVAAVQTNTLQEWYRVVSRVRGTHSASQVFQQTTRTTPNPSFAPSPRYSAPRPWSARSNYAANPPPSSCRYCGAMHWHAQCPKRPAQSRLRPVYRGTTYPQHERTVLSSPAPFRVNNTRAHVTRSPDPLYTTSPAQAVNSSCPRDPPTTATDQACPVPQDSTTIGSSSHNFR